MKTVYSIVLMLCLSLVCKAQKDWKKVSDSIAVINRAKADIVLEQFDTIQTPKLLYSIEDRYYYLIIKDTILYNIRSPFTILFTLFFYKGIYCVAYLFCGTKY